MSDLRRDFFSLMEEIQDKDTIILVGDLGYSFMENYPGRLVNCGIAEQNMVGMAAGMARAGLKPYVYSNSIFLAGRAFEQIRDDIAYPKLNVKLIGTGAAGFLGYTHNWEGEESAGNLIKPLPNISYVTPLARETLEWFLKAPGPAFIQL